MLHRQTNGGSGARQPGVDAGIGRDDLIETQMIVARDVRQRVLLLSLGLARFADQVLIGRQRKNLRMGGGGQQSKETNPP